MSGYNLPDNFSWHEFNQYFGQDEPQDDCFIDPGEDEEPHLPLEIEE